MEKKYWNDEEIISYLEWKMKNDSITEKEMDLYLTYIWNGYLDKETYRYTYKKLQCQMKKLYNQK